MKKLIMATLIIMGTLGISAYSNGKTVTEVNQSEKQALVKAEIANAVDTIGLIRIGRGNLAQAD